MSKLAENYIDIVFDGPPSHESGRFVEVENPQGESIRVGEWIDRGDGLWALRISPKDTEHSSYQMPRERGWYLDKDDKIIFIDGDRYQRPGDHPYLFFHFNHAAPFKRLVPEENKND